MDFVPEDYRIFSYYLNQYRSQKKLDKPLSPKFLFRRINQNASNLGDTVVSEYVPKEKEGSSSPFTNSHQGSSEENKQFEENKAEEKLKLSEFMALMSKREQEVFKPIFFNVMIAGESSLGKSTFIEALLDKKFEVNSERIKSATPGIHEFMAHREEGKIKLNLKLIDTPGYGSHFPIENWYKLLKEYIKSKFKETASSDERLRRSLIKKHQIPREAPADNKVHVLLYFLAGPRIKREDVIYMKKLQKYANIIPILAKGDSYTAEEIKVIKLALINQAHDHKIEWFDCLEPLKNNPEKLRKLNEGPFGPSPPFLIISSLDKVQIDQDQYVYGRIYNWGTCNIENPFHCDFILLYNLLVGHFSLELIRLTNEMLFEAYRERLRRKSKAKKQQINKRNKKIGCSLALGLCGGFLLFQLFRK